MKKLIVILMVIVTMLSTASAEQWPEGIAYFDMLEDYIVERPDGSLVDFHKFSINYYEGSDRYDYVQYIERFLPLRLVENGEVTVLSDSESLVLEDGDRYIVFLIPSRNYLDYDECIYTYDWTKIGILYY